MTRQDKTRQRQTKNDKTRQSKIRQDKTRKDKTRQHKTRRDQQTMIQHKTRHNKTTLEIDNTEQTEHTEQADPKNYRGVHLTPVLSKCVERAVGLMVQTNGLSAETTVAGILLLH
jgi:hypothetical protein